MSLPVLHIFSISHYCEKARWALDYLGVDYRVNVLAPGQHMRFARKLELTVSSLPILQTEDGVLQGSSAIIDWAEAHKTDSTKSLVVTGDRVSAREWERRLDDRLGVHVRRYYYSEALVNQPQSVLLIFARDLGLLQRFITTVGWPKISKMMIARMDLGPEQGQESKKVVAEELDWLDGILSDGRLFLGDPAAAHVSRVDITAASLLAPLLRPAQHPVYGQLQLPPGVAADCRTWADRPSLLWTAGLYRDYRSGRPE